MWGRPSPPWEEVTYWALDLETGGLDARRDAILAIGMVPVREGRVRLGEAWGTLVRPEPGARVEPSSIRAHGLVERDWEGAPPVADVLPEVARRLAEGALLVHHRAIDEAFLRRAWEAAGRRWPKPPVVDTARLLLAAHQRERRRRPELPGDAPTLQLSLAREARGLPAYPGHDAVTDALATAELFLVLREELGARTLRDLRA